MERNDTGRLEPLRLGGRPCANQQVGNGAYT